MGEQNTSDHRQINSRVQNPSQEPPVSLEASNKDLKDMYVLCTVNQDSEQGLEYGCVKEQLPYPN